MHDYTCKYIGIGFWIFIFIILLFDWLRIWGKDKNNIEILMWTAANAVGYGLRNIWKGIERINKI